jgi:AraC-like DNA-binding protein
MSSLSIETTADVVRVVHEGAGTPPAVVDNVFAAIVRVGRELTGTPLVPREVKLTRTAPRDPADHRRFFCPHVHFASREDALVFDAAALDLPLITADAELHLTLERRTEELLGTVPSRDRFVSRVRVAIVKSLQAGTGASLAALAEALDMSARTLQRRLGDSSTTRSDLVDDVRHELAVRYVRGDLGSTEIAYLLGFSDAAALHRAFKRWTGTTLKDHRAEEREKR